VLTSSCTAVSRVFAVPKQQVTRARLAHMAQHSVRPVAGILPTGWAAVNACGLPPGAGGAGRKAIAASAVANATSNANANAQNKRVEDERALVSSVGLSLPGIRLVTWTILGVIKWCFDCKIT
jgi:hypothetical protein